jgi:hypothetical protein
LLQDESASLIGIGAHGLCAGRPGPGKKGDIRRSPRHDDVLRDGLPPHLRGGGGQALPRQSAAPR